MRKFTFEGYLRKTGTLVLCFLFSSSLWGQNRVQQREIQRRTDVKGLKALEENVKKTDLSASQLQAKAKQLNIPFSYEFDKKLYQLRSFDKKGLPLYYVTYNVEAASGTMTDKLYSFGGIFNLDGTGMLIREWDGGAVFAHAEFQNRLTQKDTPTAISDHATHVAGTLVGSGLDSKARGMAYRANLDAYDWNSDNVEMTAAAAAGALVSNHSYGFVGGYNWDNKSGTAGWHWFGSDEDTEYIGYGYYGTTDSIWDAIATRAPYYLPVKAAGNPRGDGPEPGGNHYVRVKENGVWVWKPSTKVRQKNGGEFGFDCLITGSLAKNILTVAAAEKIPGGYKTPADVKAAYFSAFGPTDDGRIKPDIAGIGVDIYSTNNKAGEYTTMSGTSMASPNVTGSLALLQQHFGNLNAGQFMRSATLKALIINTANEAGPAVGPDYKYGWGLLNSFKAAQAISTRDKYSLMKENNLVNTHQDTIKVKAHGLEPLAVTLAWTDPAPGVLPEYQLDNPLRVLVNDLDLKIVKKGETEATDETFNPWILDPANPAAAATKGNNVRDNVEQVIINTPVKDAEYLVIVSHKGTLKKNGDTGLVNADDQAYSVVATGINNNVSKDLEVKEVKPTVNKESYSTATPVAITYTNKGNSDIAAAVINYRLIDKDNNNAIMATGKIDITNLPSGTTKTENVSIDLSTSFVNFTIMAEAQLVEDEIAVNNIASTDVYGILSDLTTVDAKHKFGFEAEFAKNGWLTEDVDANGKTWYKYDDTNFAKNGKSFAINFPNLKMGINDWLFSNPLKLTGNTPYRVTFYGSKLRTTPEEKLQVLFGTSPNSRAMNQPITTTDIIATTSYVRYSYEFTPAEDGIYYVGFHTQKPAEEKSYAVFIDDVAFQQAASKPDIEFTASKLKPNTYETVTFKNETKTGSTAPVTAYKWIFSPTTVNFMNGTTDVSENPRVIFNAQDTYSVTLQATNSIGESTLTKTGYIVAANTPAKASFTTSKTSVFEKEVVKFTDTSTGNPAPTGWQWTITPNENFEFQNGTSATTKNIDVKFNKKGSYTITLTATSLNNSNTSAPTNIVVNTYYEAVTELTSSYDNATKDLKLTWKRPLILPGYTENFEYGGTKPSDFTFQDEDGNTANWIMSKSASKTGTYGAASYSFSLTLGAYNVDNWMITGKIRSDVEQLKFWTKNEYKEQYEIWVVPAPASGNAPTLTEIKAGKKVYDYAGIRGKTMEEVVVDLEPANITTDVFIAFHHKTRAKDDGYFLAIDDIEVGYKTIAPIGAGVLNRDEELLTYQDTDNIPLELTKEQMKSGKYLFIEPTYSQPFLDEKITYAATTYPQLTGYEVQKDGSLLQTINGKNKLSAIENINNQTGTHLYDVYAVYSDGIKSEKQSISITYTLTGINDFSVEQMKVYPNPTHGMLYISGENAIQSLRITLHELSGKKVFENQFNANKASLDLSKYNKGAYVLTIKDNQNRKQSLNILVQ